MLRKKILNEKQAIFKMQFLLKSGYIESNEPKKIKPGQFKIYVINNKEGKQAVLFKVKTFASYGEYKKNFKSTENYNKYL